jgi:translation initiation factor 4H
VKVYLAKGSVDDAFRYSNGRDGGGAPRNHVIPDEPPFTAYIGNAPDTMVQGDFEKHLFTGLKVKQVRLVRDRQTDRFRGRSIRCIARQKQ